MASLAFSLESVYRILREFTAELTFYPGQQ